MLTGSTRHNKEKAGGMLIPTSFLNKKRCHRGAPLNRFDWLESTNGTRCNSIDSHIIANFPQKGCVTTKYVYKARYDKLTGPW